jgi:hypothetical protein
VTDIPVGQIALKDEYLVSSVFGVKTAVLLAGASGGNLRWNRLSLTLSAQARPQSSDDITIGTICGKETMSQFPFATGRFCLFPLASVLKGQ